MNNFEIIWTFESDLDLNEIYEFYFEKSPKVAFQLIQEIVLETEKLVFAKQFQLDEINPNYRRIIVRNYKVLYRLIENEIVVFAVFDCRQNPIKLKKINK